MRSDVELLRILSAFGIVWFHSGIKNFKDLFYAGLIIFVVLSIYYAVISTRQHTIKDRAIRLLIPCIFWSIVYALVSLARGRPIFPSDFPVISLVLATPSIHLWYLPFIFICIVCIDKSKGLLKPNLIAILTCIIASAMLFSSPLWRQWSYLPPFGQYIHAIPAVFIGIFLASTFHLSTVSRVLLVGILYTSIIYTLIIGVNGVDLTYLLGFSAALILLSKKSFLPNNNVILAISKLTYGIYLLHPLILFILSWLGVRSFALPISGFLISGILIYLFLKLTPKSLSKYIA